MKQIQLVKPLLALALLLALPGCLTKVDTGGYVSEKDIKTQVTVGQTDKEGVRTLLGSPSSQSSFGAETWYYITDRKEAVAFFKPEVVAQNVTRIEFDDKGVVSKIDVYNEKNSEDFDIVKRSTSTEGHTLGFFEQVLGNIGRFNAPGGSDTAAPGRKPGS